MTPCADSLTWEKLKEKTWSVQHPKGYFQSIFSLLVHRASLWTCQRSWSKQSHTHRQQQKKRDGRYCLSVYSANLMKWNAVNQEVEVFSVTLHHINLLLVKSQKCSRDSVIHTVGDAGLQPLNNELQLLWIYIYSVTRSAFISGLNR